MSYWKWDKSYEIGFPEIDKQHRCIVTCINELHEALVKNDRTDIPKILGTLAEFITYHFKFEEELMEKSNYLLTVAHKQEHKKFIKTVKKYESEFKKGEDIAGMLMAELQIWLTHHILHDDRDYKSSVEKLFVK